MIINVSHHRNLNLCTIYTKKHKYNEKNSRKMPSNCCYRYMTKYCGYNYCCLFYLLDRTVKVIVVINFSSLHRPKKCWIIIVSCNYPILLLLEKLVFIKKSLKEASLVVMSMGLLNSRE